MKLPKLSSAVSLLATIVFAADEPICDDAKLAFDLLSHNATFLNATHYPANTLNVSDEFNAIAFCEIYGAVPYGSNANNTLTFALWVPNDLSDYSDRYVAVGNGGMAGVIDYAGMLAQLNSGFGFAVAGGDAGHLASENNDGEGEPGVYLPYLHDEDQVQMWIHDAISLFTVPAQDTLAAFYGQPPGYSFYVGCSTGGAQGFALAQFHPELFDGIVAGCPGNWYSHLALSFLWNAQATNVRSHQSLASEVLHL